MAAWITEIEISHVRAGLAKYLVVDADHIELTKEQVHLMRYLTLLEQQFERESREEGYETHA